MTPHRGVVPWVGRPVVFVSMGLEDNDPCVQLIASSFDEGARLDAWLRQSQVQERFLESVREQLAELTTAAALEEER